MEERIEGNLEGNADTLSDQLPEKTQEDELASMEQEILADNNKNNDEVIDKEDIETDVEEKPKNKTPLKEEDYIKYGIPRKFKYLEDVVKWGEEAEKQKSKYESENARLRKEMEEYLEKLENAKDNANTEEDKRDIEIIKQKFIEDFTNDPYTALEKMFIAFEKRLEEKELYKQKYQENLNEERELIEKVGKEKWEQILPELKQIVKDYPNLVTPKQVYAMWLLQHQEEQSKDADKEKQKERAFSEKTKPTPTKKSASFEDIAKSVKSIDELDNIAREQGLL